MEVRFLNRIQAAQYLSERGLTVSPKTLQNWATTGGGPAYQRFGKLAVYTADALNAWAESKLTAPRRTAA